MPEPRVPQRHAILRRAARAVPLLLAAACASASDRLEEGMEAEAMGRYYRAADRYIDALDKDPQMAEARERLLEVGDSAVTESLRMAEDRVGAGDPVGGAQEIQRIDGLLASARTVGVRIPTPPEYGDTRRRTFDAAIADLMATGREARDQGRYDAGRRALVRARTAFQPSAEQEVESLEAEAGLLLDWALAEEDAAHFRRAFELSEEAVAAGDAAVDRRRYRENAGPVPAGDADVAEAALALQDRALAAGTAGLVVFPVSEAPDLGSDLAAGPGTNRAAGPGTDLAQLLSDNLELDHWRRPPPFIAVADPLLVRTVTRRLAPRGAVLRPERVMNAVDGDFGVLVEITGLSVTEEDVRQRTHTARIRTSPGRTTPTRRTDTVTWTEETGTYRYQVDAQVIIVDRFGRELENFLETGTEAGPFQRGVYEGDPGSLELSRNQARLFDRVVLARQRADIEEPLLARLAGEIAGQVYRRVLARIP